MICAPSAPLGAAADARGGGVVAMDGKSVTLPGWGADYVQRHVPERGEPFGMLRTITSALVSARSAVPRHLRSAGHDQRVRRLAAAFAELVRVHGRRFQLISYDAGGASGDNAATVVAAGKDYVFALKNDQPLKLRTARSKLENQQVVARTEDVLSNQRSVVRTLRLVPVPRSLMDAATKKPLFWPSSQSIVEVTSETLVAGAVTIRETRCFLSSLAVEALTPAQWLLVVRRHWGVENDCHKTFDVAFGEDDHPWIEMAPQGTLVVLLLRRLAYNLLSLFRSVTQRSDERRAMPWAELMRWVMWTLWTVTAPQLAGLRHRLRMALPRRRRPDTLDRLHPPAGGAPPGPVDRCRAPHSPAPNCPLGEANLRDHENRSRLEKSCGVATPSSRRR